MAAMRIRKTNLAPSGLVIKHFINANRWGPKLRTAKLFEGWEQIVGKDAAQYCQPVRLQGGVLVVAVSRADWVTSLKYMEPQLIQNANQLMGEELVKRVRSYVKT